MKPPDVKDGLHYVLMALALLLVLTSAQIPALALCLVDLVYSVSVRSRVRAPACLIYLILGISVFW